MIDPIVILLGAEGVPGKGRFGLLRTVPVAAGNLSSGDPQLTCSACRQQLTFLIYHIKLQIVHTGTDGNIFILSVQYLDRYAHTAFCGTVTVMEAIGRRIKRHQFFTAHRQMAQAFRAVHQCELAAHLGGHGGVGNALGIEILLQLYQVQADAFIHDVYGTAADQFRIGVVHVCIKAVAGIFRTDCGFVNFVMTYSPVAQSGNIAVFQHNALGHTGGAGGIQHHEQVFAFGYRQRFCDVLHIQDFLSHDPQTTLFVTDNSAELRRGNQHLCAAVLHHQIQPFRGITGIQRHIGTAGLQNTKGADHHVFTPGNQNTYDIFPTHTASAQVHGESVGDLIQLPVGISAVQIYQGIMIRPQRSLAAEKIHNGLFLVKRIFPLVEILNLCYCFCIGQFYIISKFLCQELPGHMDVGCCQIFGKGFAEHIPTVTHVQLVISTAQIGNFHQKRSLFNMLFIVDALDLDFSAVH